MNTTANKITVLRIILVPFFLLFEYLGKPGVAFALFVIASLSDLELAALLESILKRITSVSSLYDTTFLSFSCKPASGIFIPSKKNSDAL